MKKLIKQIVLVVVTVSVLLFLASCGSDSSSSDSDTAAKTEMNIAFPTWVGYGPLYVAQEQGYFEEEGLEVNLSIVEGLAERKQALASGTLDGLATAADVFVNLQASDIDMGIVWVLDASNGSDGIVVDSSITDLSQLKGQQIAVEEGTTLHLFLLKVLEANGLTEDDVTLVSMTTGEAGAAFVSGKVKAAVTYEPYLSEAENAGGTVYTVIDYPVQLVDAIGFSTSYIEENPEAIQGFVNAISKAIDYQNDYSEEAAEIMAAGLKLDKESIIDTQAKLKIYSLSDNVDQFGESGTSGILYDTVKEESDFYVDKGIIENEIDPTTLIDPTFVRALNSK